MSGGFESRARQIATAIFELARRQRTVSIERVCDGSHELRERVESLLATWDRAEEVLLRCVARGLEKPEDLSNETADENAEIRNRTADGLPEWTDAAALARTALELPPPARQATVSRGAHGRRVTVERATRLLHCWEREAHQAAIAAWGKEPGERSRLIAEATASRPWLVAEIEAILEGDRKVPSEATQCLRDWAAGKRGAFEDAFTLLLNELRARARCLMRQERPDHTLRPTALVNEFFLRLAKQESVSWDNSAQFLAWATTAMRRILIDYARRHRSDKRGGQFSLVRLDARPDGERGDDDLDPEDAEVRWAEMQDDLAVNQVLERMSKIYPRPVQVIELRFRWGFSIREIADLLDIDESTVKRDIRFGLGFLADELGLDGPRAPNPPRPPEPPEPSGAPAPLPEGGKEPTDEVEPN